MNGHIAKPISAVVILENLDQFLKDKEEQKQVLTITYISG